MPASNSSRCDVTRYVTDVSTSPKTLCIQSEPNCTNVAQSVFGTKIRRELDHAALCPLCRLKVYDDRKGKDRAEEVTGGSPEKDFGRGGGGATAGAALPSRAVPYGPIGDESLMRR